MFRVLAGSTWPIALLSLVERRYLIAARLRQAVAVVALALWVLAAWRWWTGAWSADMDTAFFIMLAGLFCDDLIDKVGERRSAATKQETA